MVDGDEDDDSGEEFKYDNNMKSASEVSRCWCDHFGLGIPDFFKCTIKNRSRLKFAMAFEFIKYMHLIIFPV